MLNENDCSLEITSKARQLAIYVTSWNYGGIIVLIDHQSYVQSVSELLLQQE